MDSLIRKVIYLWVTFMYLGQATKDVLCIPRPQSPPGKIFSKMSREFQLKTHYNKENPLK